MQGFFVLSIFAKEILTMETNSNFQKLKQDLLSYYWHHNSFRPLQDEAIDAIVEGKDAIVLFPTGGGKSLCYQLPALFLEGTCLVISPLLALMKDQVLQLQSKGIEAEYISSELDDIDAENIYQKCREGYTKLLYISPERLTNKVLLQNIEYINVSFMAVDEAHCISEWGQDFRPSYQHIKNFRKNYKKVPCMALTATATTNVLKEIAEKLELKHPEVFQKSFNRENIKIAVEERSDKYTFILDFLRFNPQSGIIYARTRRETEELTQFLHKSEINNVDFFHAGLSVKEKNERQRKWLYSDNYVLISTNAFGMGIDKDNVRFVIHLSPPASVENYFQEIGRAGRDGREAMAYLFWSQQELKNFDKILQNQIPNKQEFTKAIAYLYSIYQIADTDESEQFYQFNIQRLHSSTNISLPKLRNILNFLNNQEIIFYSESKSPSTLELLYPYEQLEAMGNKDAYFMEMLIRTIDGLSTHKAYFSEKAISAKLEISIDLIKKRIQELQAKGYLDYLDGAMAKIKFITPRNDLAIAGKWWNLFLKIQKNKVQKWAEMKFYTENNKACRMQMLLSYFGEKNTKKCSHCNVCTNNNDHFLSSSLEHEIIYTLKQKPSTLEEIFIRLGFHQREKIRENIILMLDAGKIKMLDFRTYTAV